ncbi:MAG: phospho-N-acetylmuramoyl-pentapeptide-transferase [Chitinophagaceae bacterium]|nr:MAG: phospho-N-acetylmuramoyl-pentapeptide-transferase [Chitinophagaceae bacterium]
MLYHLFEWLKEQGFKFPGSELFRFISFRALLALLLSLVITLIFGKRLIRMLSRRLGGETVRDLGLAGEQQKKGTPTMGGIIIILGIIAPTLLLARVETVYIWLMLIATVWLGTIGFVDDYLKLRAKKIAQQQGVAYVKGDKDGLAGWFKVFGQVGLGILVGSVLYFNSDVKIWREYSGKPNPSDTSIHTRVVDGIEKNFVESKDPITTIPFVKGHEFNYSAFLPAAVREYSWILYILVVIFIITAVSNGANITDGIDGLATGTSALIGVCLGIFAYASGNFLFADYLNIMYIPNLGELSIYIAAMIGACVGFLWYNSYPAQVFMGDTGSLTLGGVIASIAIIVHKELLIPIFCGVFLVELVSVMMQVSYFKYTKKKTGVGKRIFLMSPLHHHYQKKGYHESKIVTRFWILTILCVLFSIATLKIR